MSGANILLVEDNLLIALDMQEILERAGYTVTAVVDCGSDAIASASELKPDLIIMDIGLKGEMNGIETIREIHKNTFIPVIYLTGNTDQLQQESINAPHLSKPFIAEELRRLISSLLKS